jgi:hypothetical protein
MSRLEVNTKKLGEIYEEWRGNKSCYDNGRPVFEADELLDFAEYCLKQEANNYQIKENPTFNKLKTKKNEKLQKPIRNNRK